jgi:hypothetical protein
MLELIAEIRHRAFLNGPSRTWRGDEPTHPALGVLIDDGGVLCEVVSNDPRSEE